MTAFLIVILCLVLLIAVILLSVVSVKLGFKEEFYFSVSSYGITLYNSTAKPEKKKKKDKQDIGKSSKENTAKKSFFDKLKEKNGFVGAIKELCSFARFALEKLLKLIGHFKFSNICLDISVATDNAADTAIQYGMVCSFVYPIARALNSIADVRYKKIDIRSDFESTNPNLQFEFTISCSIFWLLCFAAGIFKEYNDFVRRNNLNG